MTDPSEIQLLIKHISLGNRQITIPKTSTIRELKQKAHLEYAVACEDMRLISKGKILSEEQTIEDAGLKECDAVYLTVKQKASDSPSSSIVAASSQNSQSEKESDLIKSMLGSSFAKKFLSNPDIFKSMLLSNPQMKELLEKNPQLNQMFSDPAVLNEMVEMAANPKYQNEILKNHDRALNNLESLPEGFNALKKMYSNLQEPMYKAFESAHETQVCNTIKSSRRFYLHLVPKQQINSDPLPNPWKPSQISKTSSSFLRNQDRLSSFSGLDSSNFFPGYSPMNSSSNRFTQGMFYPENSNSSFAAPNTSVSASRRPKDGSSDKSTENSKDDLMQLQDEISEIRIDYEPSLEEFEGRFAEQLVDLNSMGFNDKNDNIRALLAAGGNLNSAIEYLLAKK